MNFRDITLWPLLLSNILTIFFAVSQGWSVGEVMWIFWAQSVVIGVTNFFRIWNLREFSTGGLTMNNSPVRETEEGKKSIAIFFLVHYGFFHLVYLIFLFADYSITKIPVVDLLLIFAGFTAFGAPPKTWNATEAAQKLLSNVYRTGQRFGAGHVVDVLRGKDTDKVRQYRHNKLSTFGIGETLGDKQWRSIIRQLIIQGYLLSNAEQYGALQLTEKSRPLLKGEITLFLREDSELNKPERKKASRSKHNVSDQDRALWEALRERRKQLADELGVPPFHIFHDATLMEMMQYRPQSNSELITINGIGEVKLERYGNDFLKVLAEF